MKKTMLFLAAAVVVCLTGCTTYYRDAGVDYLSRPQSVSNAPYYTEYTLQEKTITARGEASVILGLFQIAENKQCLSVVNPNLPVSSLLNDLISPTYKAVSNAKNIALYNACTLNNADQLLGATFDYVVKDYVVFTTVQCTVRGFPAKVKGIKMIDKKPIILNKWQKIEYVKPHENPVVTDSNEKHTLSFDVSK